MSKLGKSSAGGGGVLLNTDMKPLAPTAVATTTTARVTRASSTAMAMVRQQAPLSLLQHQQVHTSKSIVSIEVNMDTSNATTAASSSSSLFGGVKKKRAALGNISNAAETNVVSSTTATSQVLMGGQPPVAAHPAAAAVKKSRFSGANIAHVIPSFGQKKLDAQLPKKTSTKASSKENLTQLAQLQQQRKGVIKKNSAVETNSSANTLALSKTTVSKSENDIKKQVDSLSLNSNHHHPTVSTLAVEQQQQQQQRQQQRADQVLGWEDMDAADVSDEFACGDYASAIFKYYRERECSFVVRDYLAAGNSNINRQMRFLLVDWMVEVQQQLEFNHEVLYLSIKLLDLYLTQQLIDKEKLQLLAAASMFIASKFEERMPPAIEDFIIVSDHAFARKDVIKMEIEVLKTVRFDLGVPLSYTFLRRYAKCIRADMKFLTLARYILELSLQDYTFAPERDSLKACAALYLAMKMACAHESQVASAVPTSTSSHHLNSTFVSTANLTSTEWNPTLIHYTNAFVHDFSHLLPLMNNLVKSAPSSKHKTIFKKYSHPVFFEVAKVPALNDYQVESLVKSSCQTHV